MTETNEVTQKKHLKIETQQALQIERQMRRNSRRDRVERQRRTEKTRTDGEGG